MARAYIAVIVGIIMLIFAIVFNVILTKGAVELEKAVSMLNIARQIYPPNKYVILLANDPCEKLAEYMATKGIGEYFLISILVPIIYAIFTRLFVEEEKYYKILSFLIIAYMVTFSLSGWFLADIYMKILNGLKLPSLPSLSTYFTCGYNSTNLCSIASSLLSMYKVPMLCLIPYKCKYGLAIYVVDRGCIDKYIHTILRNVLYPALNKHCVEISITWKQYVQCIRNIEEYGYVSQCRQYLTSSQYVNCIEMLDK